MGMKPQLFLKAGDKMRLSIDYIQKVVSDYFKEQVLVDVLLEGKMSFMEDIFKNLKGSGAELSNNMDRNGEPMNILEMAELMVKRVPKSITNSIRGITSKFKKK